MLKTLSLQDRERCGTLASNPSKLVHSAILLFLASGGSIFKSCLDMCRFSFWSKLQPPEPGRKGKSVYVLSLPSTQHPFQLSFSTFLSCHYAVAYGTATDQENEPCCSSRKDLLLHRALPRAWSTWLFRLQTTQEFLFFSLARVNVQRQGLGKDLPDRLAFCFSATHVGRPSITAGLAAVHKRACEGSTQGCLQSYAFLQRRSSVVSGWGHQKWCPTDQETNR